MPTAGINGNADYYGGYCEGGGRTAPVPGIRIEPAARHEALRIGMKRA